MNAAADVPLGSMTCHFSGMDELLREPVVSWLMRLGFLLSPPLAGLVADAAGLRLGLLVVPVAGIAVVSLGGVLRPGGRGVTRPF
ncbi:hypothetical protein BAY59_15690 [Prauserella coralliicola]|nr:hypothetical protein BAY59_15690 [Prauserella coralliicola]